jgi:O-antigen/teichoic acid export membrane protein
MNSDFKDPLSLKKNIFVSYVSQLYCALISIVMVPIYMRYMGVEAYGLVGFFIMLQMWFQLLDLGLTPTMAREAARFRGGALDATSLRRLLRALEGVFLGVGIMGSVALAAAADVIADSWLNVQQLSHNEVRQAIVLMALIIGLRWISGLYRGAISGFERLVWLGGFNISIATARFVLVIPFFIYVGTSPAEFFGFQAAVAGIELIVLVIQTYRILPLIDKREPMPWHWEPIRRVLRFSLTLAFTSSVWIAGTQMDKLVLSKLLLLADYAYFTLAVLVASGITIISGPISIALQPRLTRLSAEGDEEGLIRIYRKSTQLVCVIAIPVTLILAFFSEQVLWAWTGDAEVARKAAPVLTLYALGNGILAIGAFPYYLQVAKGDLKLHLIGNAAFAGLLVPALIWATWHFGMIGAGYAWLCTNMIYFLFWIPMVHRRFAKGLHLQWLLKDVIAIALLTVAAAMLAEILLTWPPERGRVMLEVAMLGLVLMAIAAAASSSVRGEISRRRQSQG